MKTGLGLYQKYRLLIANLNLFKFWLRKTLIGFDSANVFLQRIDKISLRLIITKYGATVGKKCDIESGQIFHNCKDYSKLTIGNNCHIGKNCFFDLRNNIIIGNNVVISMQCTLITHIDMGKSKLSEKYPAKDSLINIGDSCYIGTHSTILHGVTLGNSSLVAAGSVVTKSFSDHILLGGIPASRIKSLK